jgi:hypothetical protein
LLGPTPSLHQRLSRSSYGKERKQFAASLAAAAETVVGH